MAVQGRGFQDDRTSENNKWCLNCFGLGNSTLLQKKNDYILIHHFFYLQSGPTGRKSNLLEKS